MLEPHEFSQKSNCIVIGYKVRQGQTIIKI